ncbi:hypothetical protein BB559_001053 [Furculomyces boomerangus]|uniref:t-SNARE coiled-coil homology domain-containing protein n=2 Tax=Harpellales TaxID=61421 RepID=A0A2T9Z377_9FUNG|nr:hypothetical protein BB559_001053 [Furculomyces boomerangus]PVZ98297.1 hypothetical protein BB558_005696 [Smittium angustum]PWA02449.1 hypothetical protein BB558_001427 [Smittium angustum]
MYPHNKNDQNNQNHAISLENQSVLEAQNDIRLNNLSKKITGDIYQDVVNQNSFLDSSSTSYDNAGGLIGRSQRDLRRTVSTRNSRFLCLLVLLIVFSFFIISYLIKLLK